MSDFTQHNLDYGPDNAAVLNALKPHVRVAKGPASQYASRAPKKTTFCWAEVSTAGASRLEGLEPDKQGYVSFSLTSIAGYRTCCLK